MLVLTRKLMEKIHIGGDICITVVRLDGGQVRLGIDAPREVSVVRAELLETPTSERRTAPTVVERDEGGSTGEARDRGPLGVRTPRAGARGNGIRRRGPSR